MESYILQQLVKDQTANDMGKLQNTTTSSSSASDRHGYATYVMLQPVQNQTATDIVKLGIQLV